MYSCCLQEGIKSLIVHLIDTYSSKLESIDYVDTFQALKLKYDQVNVRLYQVIHDIVHGYCLVLFQKIFLAAC